MHLMEERRTDPQVNIETLLNNKHNVEHYGPGSHRRLGPEEWHDLANVVYEQFIDQGLAVTGVFVDADNLKDVNDSLGHEVGDKLLQVIDSSIRQTDLVGYGARVGGDEWKIISPINLQGAAVLKNRIKNQVKLFVEDDSSLSLRKLGAGVSVGIATTGPDNHISLSDLLRLADADMYQDKNSHVLEPNKRQLLAINSAKLALKLAGLTPRQFTKFLRAQE